MNMSSRSLKISYLLHGVISETYFNHMLTFYVFCTVSSVYKYENLNMIKISHKCSADVCIFIGSSNYVLCYTDILAIFTVFVCMCVCVVRA